MFSYSDELLWALLLSMVGKLKASFTLGIEVFPKGFIFSLLVCFSLHFPLSLNYFYSFSCLQSPGSYESLQVFQISELYTFFSM